jgi:ankyrin repeat protein
MIAAEHSTMDPIYSPLETVELLLGAGANPNAQDNEGNTALMRCALEVGSGHHIVMGLLLDEAPISI